MKSKNNRAAEWQLTRERLHIARPYPPRAKRPAKKIGDILSEIRPQETQETALPEALELRWALITGEQIAKHTHPVHIRGMRLTVYVDHPGWLAQIRRLPKNHLLKKISILPNMPEIRDIRFLLDPSARTFRN